MQIEMNVKASGGSVDTPVRSAWNAPRMKISAVEDRTKGAFIPGPAEIPSLCS